MHLMKLMNAFKGIVHTKM